MRALVAGLLLLLLVLLALRWGAVERLRALFGLHALEFSARHVPVTHDMSEILDVAAVDLDQDGDVDFVVAREDGLLYLWNDGGRFVNATAGTGLDGLLPAEALHSDGDDLLLLRGGRLTRLVHTGIGSWDEVEGPVPESEPARPFVLEHDLNHDGRPDRISVVGDRTLRVELLGPDGAFHDVTEITGANALTLPQPLRRLLATDVNGDGHPDLVVVAGRLYVLFHNGGKLDLPRPPP